MSNPAGCDPPKTPEQAPVRWPPTPPATVHSASTGVEKSRSPISQPTSTTPVILPEEAETPGSSAPRYFDVLADAIEHAKEYAPTEFRLPLRPVVKHFIAVDMQGAEQPLETRVVVASERRNVERSLARLSEDLEHVDLRPLPSKRPRQDPSNDSDPDVSYTGMMSASTDGKVHLARDAKRRRHTSPDSVAEESELQEVELIDSRTVSRGGIGLDQGCPTCGCFCWRVDPNARGQGSGSTTLSPQVRGKLLGLLLRPDTRLLDDLARRDRRIQSWKDVAEMVGAKREDFDRVRQAASWMQDNLPAMKAAGKF